MFGGLRHHSINIEKAAILAYRSFAKRLDPAIGPKRILTPDGGGLRGALTLGMLREIEAAGHTGSAWPITNNPMARYFTGGTKTTPIANADDPLWQAVRANIAAPDFPQSQGHAYRPRSRRTRCSDRQFHRR